MTAIMNIPKAVNIHGASMLCACISMKRTTIMANIADKVLAIRLMIRT